MITRAYHHVELLRLGDELHAAVVHDYLAVFDTWIFGCDLSTRFQEQPVSEFHDVGLVHGRDLLSIVQIGILKCVLGNAFRAELGYHLANQLSKKRKLQTEELCSNQPTKEIAYCLHQEPAYYQELTVKMNEKLEL